MTSILVKNGESFLVLFHSLIYKLDFSETTLEFNDISINSFLDATWATGFVDKTMWREGKQHGNWERKEDRRVKQLAHKIA